MLHQIRFVLPLGIAAIAQAQTSPIVRVHDEVVRRDGSTATATATVGSQSFSTSICSNLLVAGYGDPVVGGGTLACIAHGNAGTRSGADGSAFFSQINGSLRNQGIFVADSTGLHSIAIGCGGGGGSGQPGSGVGDPSPIGGTFSGMFGGTTFAPATNANGDLVFMSDINGGTSSRGLFLYKAASQTIVKVAAIGDPSPVGGTLVGVGPGSINDAQTIVFAGRGSTATNDLILKWQNGVVTKVAANGDAAPSGGNYSLLVTESFGFTDGTSIYVGPLPDINNNGLISFRGITNGGARGIVIDNAGVQQWYVQAGDPTPHGGTYFDMQGAMLNDAGQIAFFADWKPTPSTFNSGWFVGKPGNWRAALSFYDPVSTGQCFGLAYSRNPMQPLDAAGNLLQWITIDFGGGVQKDALVVSAADGSLTVAEEVGGAAPGGGTMSTFDAWPSLVAQRASFGAATPGGPHLNAYCQFTLCGSSTITYCTAKTNSLGCTPAIHSLGTSSASATSGFTVSAAQLINNKNGILIYGLTGRAATPFGGGTLCLANPIKRTPVASTGGHAPPNDCSGSLSLDMNAFAAGLLGGNPSPALSSVGQTVDTQFWSRDPGFAAPNNISLTDALEYVVGP